MLDGVASQTPLPVVDRPRVWLQQRLAWLLPVSLLHSHSFPSASSLWVALVPLHDAIGAMLSVFRLKYASSIFDFALSTVFRFYSCRCLEGGQMPSLQSHSNSTIIHMSPHQLPWLAAAAGPRSPPLRFTSLPLSPSSLRRSRLPLVISRPNPPLHPCHMPRLLAPPPSLIPPIAAAEVRYLAFKPLKFFLFQKYVSNYGRHVYFFINSNWA